MDEDKSVCDLKAGLLMCHNGDYNKKQICENKQFIKNHLSSDCFLKLESMKVESLVIANHHVAVNHLMP